MSKVPSKVAGAPVGGLYAFGWNGAGQLGCVTWARAARSAGRAGSFAAGAFWTPRTKKSHAPTSQCFSASAPPRARRTGDTVNKKSACLVESLQDKSVAMVACGGPYTVLSTDTDEVWCGRRLPAAHLAPRARAFLSRHSPPPHALTPPRR